MPKTTLAFAGALVLLGLATWLGAGRTSLTAMIPAFFGIPLGLAGMIALRDGWRKHALHAAAAIALIGALGALSRALPALSLSEPIRLATLSQLVMGIALLVYLALCIRSFIQARRVDTGQEA